jgi:hypothetical protein
VHWPCLKLASCGYKSVPRLSAVVAATFASSLALPLTLNFTCFKSFYTFPPLQTPSPRILLSSRPACFLFELLFLTVRPFYLATISTTTFISFLLHISIIALSYATPVSFSTLTIPMTSILILSSTPYFILAITPTTFLTFLPLKPLQPFFLHIFSLIPQVPLSFPLFA